MAADKGWSKLVSIQRSGILDPVHRLASKKSSRWRKEGHEVREKKSPPRFFKYKTREMAIGRTRSSVSSQVFKRTSRRSAPSTICPLHTSQLPCLFLPFVFYFSWLRCFLVFSGFERSKMGRAPCCDKANVKRGPWSPEEDAVLRNYVEKHGTGGNWIALPQKAGLKRCGKSCRLRWLNYLRPDIKHGGFTEQEDIAIFALYNQIGSRWSVIASKLPGRTDNDVKNYWNTKLKKKVMAGQIGLPTTITSSSPSSSTSTAHIHHSPSPAPPPQPPLLPAIKTQAYSSGEQRLDTNVDFTQKLYSEIAQFSTTGLMEQPDFGRSVSVSPSEDISAASSSSITVDNSSSNGCVNWSTDGVGGYDAFLSELGFGPTGDFFGGFGSQWRTEEVSPYYYSDLATM